MKSDGGGQVPSRNYWIKDSANRLAIPAQPARLNACAYLLPVCL